MTARFGRLGDKPEYWWIFSPSFEEGTVRRSRKWNATLETAQRGEVKRLAQWNRRLTSPVAPIT
jgi:hypothetical protein